MRVEMSLISTRAGAMRTALCAASASAMTLTREVHENRSMMSRGDMSPLETEELAVAGIWNQDSSATVSDDHQRAVPG